MKHLDFQTNHERMRSFPQKACLHGPVEERRNSLTLVPQYPRVTQESLSKCRFNLFFKKNKGGNRRPSERPLNYKIRSRGVFYPRGMALCDNPVIGSRSCPGPWEIEPADERYAYGMESVNGSAPCTEPLLGEGGRAKGYHPEMTLFRKSIFSRLFKYFWNIFL